MLLDISLYLVLDPVICGGADGMVRTACEAAEAGATVVQLRAPEWKKRAIYDCALVLKRELAPFRVPLIINDHADVCAAAQADGLHIGQDDLPAAAARQIIGRGRILGLSAGTAGEIREADVSLIDYLGVGPIVTTATKPDAGEGLGIEGFARLAAMKPCPVAAIGGVSPELAGALVAAGADGLAVVSAICGAASVSAATSAFKEAIFRARQGSRPTLELWS